MRSIITRSAVAVATLAVGSAALAATPATAATASGVTRDMVLTAANGARASIETDTSYSSATNTAVRSIINKSCGVDYDQGDEIDGYNLYPTAAGGSADGVLIQSYIESDDSDNDRPCVIGAIATTDSAFELSGTVSLDGYVYNDFELRAKAIASLSGDVYVTAPLKATSDDYVYSATLSVNGNAVKNTTTTTLKRVPDQKSSAEKKAAKAKYAKRIASAKKAYAKALDKAGDSKSKKAAAKADYKAARARAKSKYRYDTASYEVLKQTGVQTEARPFELLATFPNFDDNNNEG